MTFNLIVDNLLTAFVSALHIPGNCFVAVIG